MIHHTESFNPIAAGRVNVSTFLTHQAKKQPYKKAIVMPSGCDRKSGGRYCSSTFLQLEELVDSYAWALNGAGIEFGTRVLVAQQPGRELVAITFALYRIGAIPVFIDPGMGKDGILNCVNKSRSTALVGNFKAHLLSFFSKKAFSAVKVFISTSKRGFGRIKSLYQLPTSTEKFPVAETRVEDTAAILFTSGSTGPAKGVVYTHGMFTQQIQIIQEQYKVTDDDVDMSIFPLFALFAICMGMKTVIPDMDTSQPLKADPEKICRVINDQCVSFSFGSPTFWNKMADYCIETNTKLPTLRALLMAGCSVPATLHSKFLERLFVAEGDTYIPYGATESLPMTTFCGTDVLSLTAEKTDNGAGTCVGRSVSDKTTIKIIKITDEPIENWDDSLLCKTGEIGEIIVKGSITSQEYFEEDSANEKAKIRQGRYTWHRMGDIGYLDEEDLLWFCGRKADRVKLEEGKELYTDQCENIFNTMPEIYRSALVSYSQNGKTEAAIILEPFDANLVRSLARKKEIKNQALELAKNFEVTRPITRVAFHESFPVDVRHNAKIKREILTEWIKNQKL